MSMSVFQQPTSEQLAGFREGDPIAIDQVVTLVLPQVSRWALGQYSQLPEEDVLETVYLVLAEICLHHARYDSARAAFTTYVIGLLKLRLRDAYRARQRIAALEDSDPDTYEKAAALPYDMMEEPDTRVARDAFFRQVEARLDDCQRDLLRQLLDDPRDMTALQDILARHGARTASQHDIKNAQARLRRSVKSIADQMGYELGDLL